ncbi:MAG: VWA domain-containing protein [Vicinamibacterales bacterium]
MRILRPDMAVWLCAIPIALFFWWRHFRYKWHARGDTESGLGYSRRTRKHRDVTVAALAALSAGLLVAAMMRPQLEDEQRLPVFARRDLVLVLDRSISMRARDVQPSRFGLATIEIEKFLQRKPEGIDRVALVTFAGTSVVLSYPTEDMDSLSFYLDWLREDETPLFGTDIGGALATALAVVKREAQPVPAVLVVVSDGDDDIARVETAAAAITREGIRVHTIGVGSDDSVPMPVPTGGGREEFLRGDTGVLLMTRFDERTLRRLAVLTGGRYFRSQTGGELASMLDQIASAERPQVAWKTTVDYRDVYGLLLGAAAVASAGMVARL